MTEYELQELAVSKIKCNNDLLFHTRYFFVHQYNRKFVVNSHHERVCEALNLVLKGKLVKVMINIGPRYGKAIDCNTNMLTSEGWKLAKDIRINDKLIGSDGNYTIVNGVFPQGKKNTYDVIFNDNTKLNVCGEHLWQVQSRKHKKNFIKNTDSIAKTIQDSEGRYNWRIPIVKPIVGDSSINLLIEPYLLGCWLGDGSSYKAEICTMDPEIIKSFSSYGYTVRKHQNSGLATEYGIIGGFISKLKSLNLLANKHIPEIYFNSDYESRLKLIQGLCDTDGTCNKKNFQISIGVTNVNLEADIKKLIVSLGGVYRSYYRKNNKSCNISFRIPDRQPFLLKRKLQYCQVINNRTRPTRIITKIVKSDKREMVCFSVDAKDHLFCAGSDLIVTHNTEVAVKNFISSGLAINPASKFIHLSYSDDLALDNSEGVKDIVESVAYKQLFPEVKVKPGSDSKKKWYTTAGGGVYATSTAGQVTGFGAGRVEQEQVDNIDDEFFAEYDQDIFSGAMVVDDAIKPEDATSEVKRTRINQRWESTLKNRVNSRRTPIVFMGQRTHPEDICGYLMQTDGFTYDIDEALADPTIWYVLALPAIIDFGLPTERALWPFKHTLIELKTMREADSQVFDTQYQQDPQPKEGLMYQPFRTYREHPPLNLGMIKSYTDTADKGKDFLMQWIYLEMPDAMYILDCIYTNLPMKDTEPMAAQQLAKHKVQLARFESNNGGEGFARAVEKMTRELFNLTTTFQTFHQSDNKEVRIFSNSAKVTNLIYMPADWDKNWPLLYKHIKNYLKSGKNSSDDPEDALTGMVEFFGADTALNRMGGSLGSAMRQGR